MVVDFNLKKTNGFFLEKAGYINKIIMSDSGDEIVMACERGIFIATYTQQNLDHRLYLDKEEFYLENKLVS